MVSTRQEALTIASEVKAELTKIYGPRLRAVYLYGSAARDQLGPDSDIDIAVILDHIENNSLERRRTSGLGSALSLAHNTLVSFFFSDEADLKTGRFAIHRFINEEGVPA
jgi:predicted nucleotidyltransferase